jgi:hypothetical protein
MSEDDLKADLAKRAAERRKRLANLTSPEFDAWIESYFAEIAAQDWSEFDEYVMARTRSDPTACITHEPQLGSAPAASPSLLSPSRRRRKKDHAALRDRRS